MGWVKNCLTSTLAFDIAQFFPSFNHQIFPLILDKAEFDFKISCFFSNYLVSKKTKYLYNNFSFPFFDVNVDVCQGSMLSPILLDLYLSLVFHIFEKRLKNLKITVSIISFVDNGLSFLKTNLFIFQTQIFFVVIILYLFFLDNLA